MSWTQVSSIPSKSDASSQVSSPETHLDKGLCFWDSPQTLAYWSKSRSLGAGAWSIKELDWFNFQKYSQGIEEGRANYNYLTGGLREQGVRCFSDVHSDRKRGMELELKEGKFKLGIRKIYSQWSVTGKACTEMSQFGLSWRCSKPKWKRNWAICSCWPFSAVGTWTQES